MPLIQKMQVYFMDTMLEITNTAETGWTEDDRSTNRERERESVCLYVCVHACVSV